MKMVWDFIVNMIILVGVISLFNFMRCLFKIKKVIRDNKDNPNIQGITIINGQVKVIEKKPQAPLKVESIPTVLDEICHKSIKKEDAYRVLVDGKEHYFCSWECREAFMKQREEG